MITGFEQLSCDAGWRNYHFLKLTDDSGHVGWAEMDEAYSPPGVVAVLEKYKSYVLGRSALDHERVFNELYYMSRPSPWGVTMEALGAIENALLDVKGKILGVPCHQLFGGKQRDSVPIYWSHCATWRISQADHYGPPITSLEGVSSVGREARKKGHRAVKTNLFQYVDGKPTQWMAGFGVGWQPGLPLTPEMLRGFRDHLEALRDGTGPDIEILLDLNFNFRTEGVLQILRALEDFPLFWVELDNHNPEALAFIRSQSPHPIASLETLFGLRQFLPYFRKEAVDNAIVDVVWNGAWQSMKIANAAEAFDVNVAGHNFYGHLATMTNVHLLAALPNVRVLECDIDRLARDDEVFTTKPDIVDGTIVVPDIPGWGIEINEEALAKYPPKASASFLGL